MTGTPIYNAMFEEFINGPTHDQIDESRVKRGLKPLYKAHHQQLDPSRTGRKPIYKDEFLRTFPKKVPYDDGSVGRMAGERLAPMTIPPFIPRMGYTTQRPAVSPRAAVLREAEQLITGERNKTYGEPTQNFSNIAALLNVQFAHKLKPGEKFTSADVGQMMIQTKMGRLIAQPKRDNYTDIAGYAACAWECQENDT